MAELDDLAGRAVQAPPAPPPSMAALGQRAETIRRGRRRRLAGAVAAAAVLIAALAGARLVGGDDTATVDVLGPEPTAGTAVPEPPASDRPDSVDAPAPRPSDPPAAVGASAPPEVGSVVPTDVVEALGAPDGRPTIVVFGAPGCEPCVADAALIDAIDPVSSAPVGRRGIIPSTVEVDAALEWLDALRVESVGYSYGPQTEPLTSWALPSGVDVPLTVVVGGDDRAAAVHEGPLTDGRLAELVEVARNRVAWLPPLLAPMELPDDLVPVEQVSRPDPQSFEPPGRGLQTHREELAARWADLGIDDYDVLVERATQCGVAGPPICFDSSARIVVAVRGGEVVAGSMLEPEGEALGYDLREYTVPAMQSGLMAPSWGQGEIWWCGGDERGLPTNCLQSPMRSSLPGDTLSVLAFAER